MMNELSNRIAGRIDLPAPALPNMRYSLGHYGSQPGSAVPRERFIER